MNDCCREDEVSTLIMNQDDLNHSKKAHTRNELLHTALERFAKYGYHNTKISDIVSQAGVSQGTFYWHFKSKEAIALEIIRIGREEIARVIAQGYRSQTGTVQDMVNASQSLFVDLYSFAGENRYLMELLLGGISNEASIREAVHDTRIEMEKAFRRNIERAMELGMLPSHMDPCLKAAFLTSLVEGTISRWLFGPKEIDSTMTDKSIEELAAETARFEFFGLLGI